MVSHINKEGNIEKLYCLLTKNTNVGKTPIVDLPLVMTYLGFVKISAEKGL